MWKEILALSNTGQANKELITWQSVEDILLKLAWRKKFIWDHQVTVLETVSFSSMPSEKKVSSAADCLAFMQGGCELKKVRPNSRIYSRFYTLDPEREMEMVTELDLTYLLSVRSVQGKAQRPFSTMAIELPCWRSSVIVHWQINGRLLFFSKTNKPSHLALQKVKLPISRCSS